MSRVSNPEKQPEQIFLLCALLFGLITIFVTPPFQAPDEYGHFFRAYYTSQGGLIGDTAQLPASIVELADAFPHSHLPLHPTARQDKNVIFRQFSIPFVGQPVQSVSINNTIFYSAIPYLPQSIGVLIGRTFSLSPICIFYLGRLFNLLVWIFVCVLAISITPFHKWVLVLLCLMPMTLFQASSNSTDAMVISLCFLFVAVFLSLLKYPGEVIPTKKIMILLLLGVLLALSKHILGLLVCLLFLIPVSKMGGWKRYLLLNVLVVGIVVAVALGWYSYVSPQFIPDNPGAMPPSQIQFILRHPVEYTQILMNSALLYGPHWKISFTGLLGWLDTAMPQFIYDLYLPILFLCALIDTNRPWTLNSFQRLGLFAAFLCFSLIIVTSMFIQWTIPGGQIIEGVQGRYFIPFAWLILLVFQNQRFLRIQPKMAPFVFLIAVITLDSLIYSLVIRYYL